MGWTFNFGEWTEAYVFLRLLGNGKMYAATSDFMRDESVYIDIINIVRYEKDKILQFERKAEECHVEAYNNGVCFKVLSYSELNEKADFLYNKIKGITSTDRKFAVAEIEEYLKELNFSQPKVPPLPKEVEDRHGKKTDIIIVMQDSKDHSVSTTGFSIKSHLGSDSSLFNTAPSSNLIYKVVGCTDEIMNEINANQIQSEVGMFAYIRDNDKLNLEFAGTTEEFQNNLDFIELTMPEVFNCAMLIQIGYLDKSKSNSVKDITKKISEYNPVNVRRPDEWYSAKMKDFLYASFSGLTASKPWDGRKKLSGGYIDVNLSGELLFYRAVSDDIFNTFLYEHTYFDRPSRGVNKDRAHVMACAALQHREVTAEELDSVTYKIDKEGKRTRKGKYGDWGYIYKMDGEFYINLNFQIRFK